MIFPIVTRAVGVITLIVLILCFSALYRAFDNAPPEDKGAIAWGLVFELVFMITIVIRLVTG